MHWMLFLTDFKKSFRSIWNIKSKAYPNPSVLENGVWISNLHPIVGEGIDIVLPRRFGPTDSRWPVESDMPSADFLSDFGIAYLVKWRAKAVTPERFKHNFQWKNCSWSHVQDCQPHVPLSPLGEHSLGSFPSLKEVWQTSPEPPQVPCAGHPTHRPNCCLTQAKSPQKLRR